VVLVCLETFGQNGLQQKKGGPNPLGSYQDRHLTFWRERDFGWPVQQVELSGGGHTLRAVVANIASKAPACPWGWAEFLELLFKGIIAADCLMV
jgi:hypothetical protein